MTVADGGTRTRTFSLQDDDERIDGRPKVRGAAMYVADFKMPGMLWAAYAKSTMAHARIVAIDTTIAEAIPGVHAVLTGALIGDRRLGRCLQDWPVLAYERTRFIGEYIAAVAAETPQIAQAAADAIEVRYEELPAVFTYAQAVAPGAELLHENYAAYAFIAGKRALVTHPNLQAGEIVKRGDADAAFARAARVVSHRFSTPRMHPGYIEPRATVVWIEDDGVTHVRSTNKMPYALRAQLSATTGEPIEKFVVEPAFIGGDFGGKGLSVDEFICYYLARAAQRPVKSVRSYLDDIQSTNVRHQTDVELESALDADGRWIGHRARIVYDGGAYAAGKPIPHLMPGFLPQTPYDVPNAHFERVCFYSNTVPGGHVRAPSDVQVLFALESHVDLLARELGEDPLEFRLRHVVRGSHPDMTGVIYHEPRAAEILERLKLALAAEPPLPPDCARAIAISARHIGVGKTSADYVLRADGTVEVRAGMVEQGSGMLTMVARLLASELCIDLDTISVVRKSTSEAPVEGGAGASKVTHILGRATQLAADELKRRMCAAVAQTYGVPVHSVSALDGRFDIVDGRSFDWQSAARVACAAGDLVVESTYDSANLYPHGSPEANNFCAFAATVQIDTDTGALTVHDILCVVDVGAIINPIAHRGQIDGGFIWGFGSALMEDLIVEDGKIQNLSLADYKIPTMRDIPPFRVIQLQSNDGPGPLGAKAAGEVSTAAVAPALANAVHAACGARIMTLPLSAERIFNAIQASVAAASR